MLFLACLLPITYLSLFTLPDAAVEDIWFENLDKIVHFSFYLVLSSLTFLALQETFPNQFIKQKALGITFMFCFCYGLLIEVLQHLMPFDRMFEFGDIIANTVGAFMGCWLIQKYGSLIPFIK